MDRRDLLRGMAAAGALALLPRDAMAIWSRVAEGVVPAAGLSTAQLALIGAIADTILPRSSSPSATEVKVPAFVDVVVSENYTDDERTTFVAGLRSIAEFARQRADTDLTTAGENARTSILTSIEALSDRRSEPSRTYWRLKGLIIHGYFTSEIVMKQVLHYQMVPGRFDGAAPLPHA